nr:Ca(2+)-independent N-acyltransferase [Loxodonta africana]
MAWPVTEERREYPCGPARPGRLRRVPPLPASVRPPRASRIPPPLPDTATPPRDPRCAPAPRAPPDPRAPPPFATRPAPLRFSEPSKPHPEPPQRPRPCGSADQGSRRLRPGRARRPLLGPGLAGPQRRDGLEPRGRGQAWASPPSVDTQSRSKPTSKASGGSEPEVAAPPQVELRMALAPQKLLKGPSPKISGKPKPRPGDLIEIFRIGYEHWAIYVEDDYVVHLASPSEEFEAGSITSVFSNRAVVKYSRLEDVLHGCSWKINNKLDGTYLPLPVDKIIQRTKMMINKIVQYSLIEGNCEHFVNDLRYGVPRSQQVEHALREGAKAAGAVISAVVDSIRPKPVTA